ncbi:cell death abnormality protein 1-like [Haliotis cracherodii]|uniref:cell death abnormality protein 1-like n=1 Tax=Haliotis cracherodii TaxID=6455 RepID=UPI0039ECF6AD
MKAYRLWLHLDIHLVSRDLEHFMTSLAIVCLAFIVLIIRATPCRNGQHCRDCDNNGDCSTQCTRGYFGKKCSSECSIRCKIRLCELTAIGIETCTEGCDPGYTGTSCKIPCGNPGTQCSACEGGCDGGYCILSPTSCVSGCVDSYYGLDCKKCSERCKSCNRSTGMCDRCRDPYRGLNCDMSCEHCAGSCESGCEGGCQPGFYGHWCDKVCSENCRPGPDTDSVSVLECDNNTGDCIDGCNVGWYGTNCSSRCYSNCAQMSCTESGACVDGCVPGYAGTDCSCYENCIDHECHSENGTCVKGCDNGYYGTFCNNTCEICIDGICDTRFGICTKGCNISDQRCKSTCSNGCPLATCLKDSSCSEPTTETMPVRTESLPLIAIIIGTSAAFLLCITVAICIGYHRRRKRNAEAQNYIVEYQPPSNRYWEIRDVNQEVDSPENESNDVIPALAEQLEAAHGSGMHDDLSSNGSSGDNLSYTHLVRDIGVNDQTTYIKYITPSEEKDVQCTFDGNANATPEG